MEYKQSIWDYLLYKSWKRNNVYRFSHKIKGFSSAENIKTNKIYVYIYNTYIYIYTHSKKSKSKNKVFNMNMRWLRLYNFKDKK